MLQAEKKWIQNLFAFLCFNASNITIAAVTDKFNESILPFIGMVISFLEFSNHFSERLEDSFPIIIAQEPVYFTEQ